MAPFGVTSISEKVGRDPLDPHTNLNLFEKIVDFCTEFLYSNCRFNKHIIYSKSAQILHIY
jgi:hypothetical protein